MATDATTIEEADPQDLAEVFDETNLTKDGEEIANFDDLPDVYDATQALGDERDDDALDAGEVDPDALDDEDLEDDPDDDDELRDDLETEPEDALPSDDDNDDVADEAPTDGAPDHVQRHQDDLLDEGVEETFPASDPVSVKRIT